MQEKEILFLRHGQTDWNVAFRYQGRTDVPLNDEGENQARKAAARFSSWIADEIYVSPLVRAYRTAEIVTSVWKNPPLLNVLPQLQELSFGDWEGKSIGSVMENYGSHYDKWVSDPGRISPPGGEFFSDALARARSAISVIEASEAKKILVVTHGGLIRIMLSLLFDIPSSSIWNMRLGNCSMTGVSLWGDKASLMFLNDCVHERVEPSLSSKIPLSF